MRYAIITNPVSGGLSPGQKRFALANAARILGAKVHGLDTRSAEEFRRCAEAISGHCDVLVAAGGDGTFSDVINSIDTSQAAVGFLPLGTGNALRHALKYRGGLARIARRIKEAKIHRYDLIDCEGKVRAFAASVGIEGTVVQLRQRYLSHGGGGFNAYLTAFLKAYFRIYKRADGVIRLDGKTFEVKNLLSLMVVKQPYYGFGMNVVPKARFDDRRLHTLCIDSGLVMASVGGLAAFAMGNPIGRYRTGKELTLHLNRPLALQLDGNPGWEADTFSFKVLPGALNLKC
ncbi:MAG: diacylglycerol kinase family protein [Desulfobacterales bacterium]|jgi:diacylglycerol kinase family enzyme